MKPSFPLHTARRGFTLIEMIVTLSILLVMLGLINFIFRDTQRAVSLGIETGETIGAQRGIASQIRRDFEQLVGPHQGTRPDTDDGGGFLVLTQKLISDDGANGNNGLLDNNEGLSIELPTNNAGANAGTTTEVRLVRSDQIGFIRNRGSDQPVGPRDSDEFTSRRVPDPDRTVDFARVWYGHALRTQENGEPPASNAFLGGSGSGNENPLDWLLARQAIFLDDTAPSTAGPLSGIRATGLQVDSAVVGHSGVTVAEQLANGLADYAVFGFEYDADDPRPSGSLVSGDGLTIPGGIPDPLLPAIPDSTAASQEAYESVAINVATYAARRLLANPAPSNDYETWQIAQAHAVLNEGCSDFAIEFAADMYGGDDTPNQANLAGGAFAPDGQIDLDLLGNIAWYSWDALRDPALFPQRGPRVFPPATDYPPIAQGFTPGVNASAAFVLSLIHI